MNMQIMHQYEHIKHQASVWKFYEAASIPIIYSQAVINPSQPPHPAASASLQLPPVVAKESPLWLQATWGVFDIMMLDDF